MHIDEGHAAGEASDAIGEPDAHRHAAALRSFAFHHGADIAIASLPSRAGSKAQSCLAELRES